MKIVWEPDDIMKGIMVSDSTKTMPGVWMIMLNEAVTTDSKYGVVHLDSGLITVLGATATDLATMFNQKSLIPTQAAKVVSSELKTLLQQVLGQS